MHYIITCETYDGHVILVMQMISLISNYCICKLLYLYEAIGHICIFKI